MRGGVLEQLEEALDADEQRARQRLFLFVHLFARVLNRRILLRLDPQSVRTISSR